jgi:hypothetical protein
MAPGQELFISAGKWQKQRMRSRKSFLGSIPGEDSFCSSKTVQDKRTVPRPEIFVSAERQQRQRKKPRKLFLGSPPGEYTFCTRIILEN